MNRTIRVTGASVAVVALMVGAVAMTGCESILGNSRSVVTKRTDPHDLTIVRAYSLQGVGLREASVDEIEAFMNTIEKLVVSKQWESSRSAFQVFGSLMTIRTTADNHLLIEDYLERVRRVVSEPQYTLRNTATEG